MFLSVIVLALVAGALAGGGLPRLADLRLNSIWILGLALALRFGAGLLRQGNVGVDLPLGTAFIAGYALIFVWLWSNWRVPGLQIAAVGIVLNTLAVALNGGQMPIWSAAFTAAGFTPAALADDPFHFLLTSNSVADFVSRGGTFGDVVPLPIPVIRDVVSIGDLLVAVGIFWAIVYSMTRSDAPTRAAYTLGLRPGDPFATASAFPGGQAQAVGSTAAVAAVALVLPTGEPSAGEVAVRAPKPQSPYLALVRNRNFSLLWVGQLVSFFGDRVHQVAIGFLVLTTTKSPLDVGIVFAATAVPNVFLGPLAGALVDRWDRRKTMIVCDLLRAGLVLLVPVAINVHIALVYVIALAVATVGLLFRPAKTAIVPLIVEEGRLVTANSASSISETLADLLGYPVAATIVAGLGAKLIGAAFVLDAATYVVSAVLIWGMLVPREELSAEPFSVRAILREMAEGWRFLTHKAELLANTVVSTVAQLAFGAEIVSSLVYAQRVLDQSFLPFPENYGWLMASLGLGSVVGGVAIGWFAPNAPKGPMTIAGFIGLGTAMVGAGLTTSAQVAIVLFFLIGVANMLYLVPTITLFQE
ncbi:MAG: MFS transporter, partial [Chloroflexota bacterium]